MQRSSLVLGAIAAGVAIALITSIGAYTTLAESQSNIKAEQDEEMKSLLKEMSEMKSMISTMNEKMDMMIEGMDMMIEGMDMMMGMLMGDMMGPMDDMMNQEPLDVIIKPKAGHGKVPVGKETEIVLLVLDKQTQKPLEGLQVVIGIERGSSMSTMEMMGDMFEAEDNGKGEYIVRFMPDVEGVYTIHTMVMLPFRSMMDNHMDFSVIAE